MLKIVIVDDEKNVRIVIKKLLTFTGIDYEVVGEAPSIPIATHTNYFIVFGVFSLF